MSLEDKDIDQLFNNGAQMQKVPKFAPSYWKEMATILDQRDARKKGFLWWTLGGMIMLSGLLITLFLLHNTQPVRYVKNKINNIQPVFVKASPASSTNTANNNTNSHHKITSVPISKESEYKTDKKQKFILSKRKENKEHTRSATLPPLSIYPKNKNKSIYAKGKSIPTSSPLNNLTIIQNNSSIATKSHPTHHYTNIEANNKHSQKINKLPTKKTKIIALNYTKLKDTKWNRAPKNYALFLRFGGGLMENYKTKRPYESGIFNLSFQLEYKINNLLLRTGVGTQFTTNSDLIMSKREKAYELGASTKQYDLSYQSLWDIYIPIEFGYQLRKYSFGVGAQGNYLLTTKMTLLQYKNHILSTSADYYGNHDGLHRLSAQGYVWFEYQFSSLFSLGTKIGTHITSRIKEGKYFNKSAATNPLYGEITLRFNLVK